MASVDPLVDILGVKTDDEEYLTRLRSITNLDEEEAYLKTSYEAIESRLVSLTQHSSDSFISGHSVLSQLSTQFEQLKSQVQDLQNVLSPAFQVPHLTNTEENENIIALKHIDQIQDVLELPTLCASCVRNGFYSEALDLSIHAKRLQVRYSNIKMIGIVVDQVNEVLVDMAVQLIRLMRESSRLPFLIKSVSYLRRLPPLKIDGELVSFTDSHLLRLFFNSRQHFINAQFGTLRPLLSVSYDKYLKRYIEVFREHVYATITSIKSVFPDSGRAGEILSAEFLRHSLDGLLETISEVPNGGRDANSSLWLQLAYCSQSLGRVGGEFWPSVHLSQKILTDLDWRQAIEKQIDISSRLQL